LFRETWTVLVLVLQVVSDKKGGQPEEEEERRGPRPARRVSGGLFALHRFGQLSTQSVLVCVISSC
jgi:hypothetical protein